MTIYLPGFRKESLTSECPSGFIESANSMPFVKIIYTCDAPLTPGNPSTPAQTMCLFCPWGNTCPIPVIITSLQDLTGILLDVKKCKKAQEYISRNQRKKEKK